MKHEEMAERAKTPENFSNNEWQNGFAHGVDGTSPRFDSEEYKNGYSHGYMADAE